MLEFKKICVWLSHPGMRENAAKTHRTTQFHKMIVLLGKTDAESNIPTMPRVQQV